MRNLYYVAIEGTIGVGKTSLANLLSEKLTAKLVLEAFEDNPFLSDFYEDPERHAFQTQLWFLLQRYQQQQDLRQVDMFQNLVITDYMFVKDRLFASLNLNEKEMSLYDTVANMMERNVIHPDLVIRFGRKPTSKILCKFLDKWNKKTFLIDPYNKFNDDCQHFFQTSVNSFISNQIKDISWKGMSEWKDFLYKIDQKIKDLISTEKEYSEGSIARDCQKSSQYHACSADGW